MFSIVCSLDVGSTRIKGTLRDDKGTVLARVVAPYSRPTTHEMAWESVAAVIQELAAAGQPDVVIVGAQMAGVCLLDANRTPIGELQSGVDLRPTDTGVDTRASGCAVGQTSSIDGIVRQFDVDDTLRDRVCLVGGVKEFVLERMTGSWVTDPASACATGMFDLDANDWSRVALGALGFKATMLPEVHDPSEIVGAISRRAAGECGLSEGTPVLCGTGDGPAANLSAGADTWHEVCVSIGTTTVARLLGAGTRPNVPEDWFVYRVADGWWSAGVRAISGVIEGVAELLLDQVFGRFPVTRVAVVGGGTAGIRESTLVVAVEEVDGTRGLAAIAQGTAFQHELDLEAVRRKS